MSRRKSSSKHGLLWWIFVVCFAWPFVVIYYGIKWIIANPKRLPVALAALLIVGGISALAVPKPSDEPIVAASAMNASPAPTTELTRSVPVTAEDEPETPAPTFELAVIEDEEAEATAEPTPDPTAEPTPEPTPTPVAIYSYVLNTNTMKFHKPTCSSVSDMKASNRWDYEGTREEVIAMGYEPCGRCHP